MPIPVASSMTHQHIGAVINTLLDSRKPRPAVRILDLGCGTGHMLAHLVSALSALRPGMAVEGYGLDVSNAGVQPAGFFEETRRTLSAAHPQTDWHARLALISTKQAWPYEDGFFDFIVSNQVLEHVADHNFVFGEIRRCLTADGVNVNLFPVKEVIMEGHAIMPLVHRIHGVERREKAMLLLARLGFRAHYRREMARRGWRSLEEFAATFARVLETDTNYMSVRELRATARKAGLAASFEFSKDYYLAKVLSYAGVRPYKYKTNALVDWAGLQAAKRITSVTMQLRHVAAS